MSMFKFNPLWFIHSLIISIFKRGKPYEIKCPKCGKKAHWGTDTETYFCQNCGYRCGMVTASRLKKG